MTGLTLNLSTWISLKKFGGKKMEKNGNCPLIENVSIEKCEELWKERKKTILNLMEKVEWYKQENQRLLNQIEMLMME